MASSRSSTRSRVPAAGERSGGGEGGPGSRLTQRAAEQSAPWPTLVRLRLRRGPFRPPFSSARLRCSADPSAAACAAGSGALGFPAIPGWTGNGRHLGLAGNGDHDRYWLCAEPPRPVGMSGRTGRQPGTKGDFEGCQGPPKGLGIRLGDRELMLNSPVHPALPPNLRQSFSREARAFQPGASASCQSWPWSSQLGLAVSLFVRTNSPRAPSPGLGRARGDSIPPRGRGTPGEGADRARHLGRRGAPGARSRPPSGSAAAAAGCTARTRELWVRRPASTASPPWAPSTALGGRGWRRLPARSQAHALRALLRVGQKKCPSVQTPPTPPQPHPVADGFLCNWLFYFVGSILNQFLTWCPLC